MLLLTFLALIAGAESPPVELALFSDAPDVRIERYAVAGRSPSALRRAIIAARPADAAGGRFDGLTTWNYGFTYLHDGAGVCLPQSAEVRVEITVTLPAPSELNRLDARARRAWDGYITGLASHERNHVRIVERGLTEFRRAVRSAPDCAGMQAAAQRVSRDVEAASREYDRRTGHGQSEIPPFG